MRTLNSPENRRNMGFWNEATQQSILDMELVIGGTGGTGNAVGIRAAHMGVQRFKVADPEYFDRANSNRVMGARDGTIGHNKAEVLAEDIREINPDAQVTVYPEGLNEDNIGEFLATADVALNGLELTRPELGTMLARESRGRTQRINHRTIEAPLAVIDVEYIAHAGQVTVFDPRSKHTFERIMGIVGGEDAPYDEIAEQHIDPSRYLAYLPPYGDLDTLKALKNGAPLPSNMIGAGVAADLALAEILKIARERVGERTLPPTYAPHFRWYDAYTGKSGQTRFPRASYYRHLGRVVGKNLLNRHEAASYTSDDRIARGDFD